MSRILIIGGGPAGLQATQAALDQGMDVTLLEQKPVLGGKRSALLSDDAVSEPEALRAVLAQLRDLADAPHARIMTDTTLTSLSGTEGNFVARYREQARYVTSDCTRCGHCVSVCPQIIANEFDEGLTTRKAIFGFLAGSVPSHYTIDQDACLNEPPNYLPCQRCSDVCDDNAIDFSMIPVVEHVESISAVVLACGYEDHDLGGDAPLSEFGYGDYPDVLTTVEMKRLLESPGPSGGFAVRLSNEEYPDTALLVLPEVTPCSVHVISNQFATLVEQDIEVSVLVLSQPSNDELLVPLKSRLLSEGRLLWGAWLNLTQDDGMLKLSYIDLSDNSTRQLHTELIVLATGMTPRPLPADLPLALSESGYVVTDSTGRSSVAGIYAIGGQIGTFSMQETLTQARSAVEHCRQIGKGLSGSVPDGPTGGPAAASQTQLESVLHKLMELGRQ